VGERSHINIRLRARRFSGHRLNCVIIVAKNDREPIKRSRSPSVEPRSRWYEASFIDSLPTTRENIRGRKVAACFETFFSVRFSGSV